MRLLEQSKPRVFWESFCFPSSTHPTNEHRGFGARRFYWTRDFGPISLENCVQDNTAANCFAMNCVRFVTNQKLHVPRSTSPVEPWRRQDNNWLFRDEVAEELSKCHRWPVLGNRCSRPSEVTEVAVKVKRNYPIFRLRGPHPPCSAESALCEVILHPLQLNPTPCGYQSWSCWGNIIISLIFPPLEWIWMPFTLHGQWYMAFYAHFKGTGLASAPASKLIMVRANYRCFFDSGAALCHSMMNLLSRYCVRYCYFEW